MVEAAPVGLAYEEVEPAGLYDEVEPAGLYDEVEPAGLA